MTFFWTRGPNSWAFLKKRVLIWVGLCLFCALSKAGFSQVVINEIHYKPEAKTDFVEFIELHNVGGEPVNLSGWSLADAVSYTFPPDAALAAGGYLVVAEDVAALAAKFGTTALGPYEGRLANDGERLLLLDAEGERVDKVDYQMGFPWPTATSGDGPSMELMNPALDNDLGGSWRPSGYSVGPPKPPRYLINSQSDAWLYRKGKSEPRWIWSVNGFELDASWVTGQASIGYGDADDNTVLSDMRTSYSTLYLRHAFTVDSYGDIGDELWLQIYVDDGCIVYLNGIEVARFHVSAGGKAYNDFAENHEAAWEEIELPDPQGLLNVGVNVLAIHALNSSLNSSDFSIDATLFFPPVGEVAFTAPTPGEINASWTENAPPQIRQVDHSPKQPVSDEATTISAKITDPDGVASVDLFYQVVAPGDFIPAFFPLPHSTLVNSPSRPFDPNPAFEDPANWTQIAMADDGLEPDAEAGDGVYTALIPGQVNRTLMRYRIMALDTLGVDVTAPYRDDPSLNFAYFVYDGVPSYKASLRSVHPGGAGHAYPTEVLESLPVYHLITRPADLTDCIGYSSADRIPKSSADARSKFNWEGAFFYDGVVYDHILYRLRQANARYSGSGKRSMRFRFPKGNYLRARDAYGRKYPTRWRTLNSSKMVDNKGIGNFGLAEGVNEQLWNLVGAPAAWTHMFHFRVIDGVDEVPSGSNGQYYGDFWGMSLAMEDYDPRFLEGHGLTDGNMYKLKDRVFSGNKIKRNQGRYATTGDGDYQYIRARNLDSSKSEEFLSENVNYDKWNRYHAVVEGVRHFDFRPADSHMKNRAWFFEPREGTVHGRLWVLPHDSDSTWGTDWSSNYGEDFPKYAIFKEGGKPGLKQKYRNYIREFRDLVWTEEVIHQHLDDYADHIREFVMADRDRWRSAPSDAGRQDYGAIEPKVQNMKEFAFIAWSGGNGTTVPAGGRAKHLENLANAEGDSTNIPDTPTVTATVGGPPLPLRGATTVYPLNALAFDVTSFSDPQGSDTFASIKWRLGQISDPATYDSSEPRKYEIQSVWESAEMTAFSKTIVVPPDVVEVGGLYRVRARMTDDSARTSHWSAPVEFRVGESVAGALSVAYLRVTEIMYNSPHGGDMDFIELHNVSPSTTLDLAGVAFTDGIQYVFPAGATLAPGAYMALVADPSVGFATFKSFYTLPAGAKIAGPYESSLSNGGEQLTLSTAVGGTEILSFEYNDSGDWPGRADGDGSSLELKDVGATLVSEYDLPEKWRSSSEFGGSPGWAGLGPLRSIIINEVLAHTDLPLSDSIELHNPTTETIDLSDWTLSDSNDNYFKFAIPEGATLAPGDYVVFNESDFNPTPLSPGLNDFALSSAHGDDVYLMAHAGDGLYRFADDVSFGASANGEAFGRTPNATGGLYPSIEATLGFPNSAPRVGPLILSEIHYNPAPPPGAPVGADTSLLEFVEIFNPTGQTVYLTEWRIRKGISFDFAPGLSIAPQGVLVVVPFDPAAPLDAALLSAFQLAYGVGPTVALVGPYSGSLSNGGEKAQLQRPDEPPLEEPDFFPGLIEDEADYNDTAPWPLSPDGAGDSLTRLGPTLFGHYPASWMAAPPSPGTVDFSARTTPLSGVWIVR